MRHNRRSARSARRASLKFERLEARGLLSVAAPGIAATGGLVVAGQVVPLDVQTAAAATTVNGQLDPITQTGAPGYTSINRPTFIGTAPAFAVVTLYLRRSDQAQFTAVGQALADSSGAWHISAGALPDGVYDVGASLASAASQPGPILPLSPGGRLVIDTAPPAALSARLDRGSATVVVTLRDGLSGVDPSAWLSPTLYALTVHGRFRADPASVTVVPTSQVVSSDAVAVALHFDGQAAAWAGRRGAAIELGPITDRAGNPIATHQVAITLGATASPTLPAARSRRR
jgi:Bacterial Ig-like domain